MWYRSGTLSLTNGSTAVTGVGTDFLGGAGAGEALYAPDGKLYEIASITSATSLTLATAYAGASASGQTYSIVPSQSYIRDLAAQAATLVSNYGSMMTNAGTGKFSDGTVSAPGISFTDDTNTGLARTGPDVVALVAGGTSAAMILPGGLQLTGVPVAPTATAGTNTTQIATTAFATAADTAAIAAHVALADPHPTYTTVAEAAAAAPVQSVAGRTGAVTLAKADVGLSNVDNTSNATERAAVATLTNKTLVTPILSTEAIPVTTNNFPSIRPTLNLDFANSQTVDPRITFTRASTATRTNAKGLLESVASGVPRIDYDPITMACKGLLVEEARTNLLTYSQDIDNAAWVGTGLTIATNAAVAPDGTITADKLVENTSTGQHRPYRNISGTTNSSAYTVSVYAKADTRNRLYIGIAEGSTYVRSGWSVFDLAAGSVVSFSTGGGAIGGTAAIQNVGGGWYRCSYTLTLGGSDTSLFFDFNLISTGTTISYTGDGVSGLYIWGAQLEAGAFPTSYIPTTTAAATRAADVAVMTGTNFSSWYRQDEGSFAASFTRTTVSVSGRVFTASDGSANEQIRLNCSIGDSGTRPDWQVIDGGSVVANVTDSASAAANALLFSAGAYKLNDFALVTNGTLGTVDASGTLPTLDRVHIGANESGSTILNGHIRNLRYYPTRLSNTQLQALSTQ